MSANKPSPSILSASKTVAAVPRGKRGTPTRAQKQEATRQKLVRAAAEQIGLHGYAGATIQKITAAAHVANGTFYNYFTSQQDLFDQLLPELGNELLDEIRNAIRDERDGLAREELGFRAFFDYISRNPAFYRILNEAEIFAPAAYRHHIDNMVHGYFRALQTAKGRGEVGDFTDRELEVIVYILLSARNYLSYRFLDNGSIGRIPDWTVSAYMKFISGGISTVGKRRTAMSPKGRHDSEDVFRIVESPDGEVAISMLVGDGHLDDAGCISRAALTGLVERVGGHAIRASAGGSAQLINLTANFVRPSHARELVAKASVPDHSGNLLCASVEIRETAGGEVLVATGSLIFMIG